MHLIRVNKVNAYCYSRLFDALCRDSSGQLKASILVRTRGEQGEIFPERIDPGQTFPGHIFPGRIFPKISRKWRAKEKVKRRIICKFVANLRFI